MNKTLTCLAVEYREHLRARRYDPRTLHKKRLLLTGFVGWLEREVGVVRPDGLQPRHLEAWQQYLSARTSARGRPLRPASLNALLSAARGFLSWLARQGFILKSLTEALKRVREPQLLSHSVLTHEQVRRLLRGIDTSTPEGYRNRALLELLYSSGLRAAEALGLDVADVNLEQGTALIRGKGAKERMVPIGRTALRYLESYLKAVRPFLLRNRGEPALFLSKSGRRLAYHHLRYLLRIYTGKTKLGMPITPHTFRRSCATELIRGGANVYHVKELLGHETLSTMKHYTRLTIVDLRKMHAKCHPRERESGR